MVIPHVVILLAVRNILLAVIAVILVLPLRSPSENRETVQEITPSGKV